MGLSSDIQNLVQQALGSLGDIRKTFTFVAITPGTYDPLTGDPGNTIQEISVRGVLTRFQSGETNNVDLLQTGRKALIPALEFGSVDPDALEDYVVVDSKRYTVNKIVKDPADALYIMHLAAVED